ncbi:MAG: hypothetical protein R3C44_23730 [Chloroflexota bacterium]
MAIGWGFSNSTEGEFLPDVPYLPVWSPDGTGLLAMTFDTETQAGADLFVSADGTAAFSLSDWLGGRIDDPYWVRQ